MYATLLRVGVELDYFCALQLKPTRWHFKQAALKSPACRPHPPQHLQPWWQECGGCHHHATCPPALGGWGGGPGGGAGLQAVLPLLSPSHQQGKACIVSADTQPEGVAWIRPPAKGAEASSWPPLPFLSVFWWGTTAVSQKQQLKVCYHIPHRLFPLGTGISTKAKGIVRFVMAPL